MFSLEFKLFFERYVAIPAVGWLITHKIINVSSKGFYQTVISEGSGIVFMLLAYWLTHRKNKITEEVITPIEQDSLWRKLITWAFVKKTVTIETPSTPQQ